MSDDKMKEKKVAGGNNKAGSSSSSLVIKPVKQEMGGDTQTLVTTASGIHIVPAAAATAQIQTSQQVQVQQQPQQQIYIIQTGDGNVPMESAEVVVADDMAVYETVSALEQLSRGQVVTTSDGGEQLIQVGYGVVRMCANVYNESS